MDGCPWSATGARPFGVYSGHERRPVAGDRYSRGASTLNAHMTPNLSKTCP